MMDETTPTITLNGTSYGVSDLTQTARDTLQSIRFVEAKLQQLQSEIAINRAAHLGFMQGLKTELAQQAQLRNR